jgi:hypothetical protein
MKNKEFLKDLHIGKIIKEIALQQNISSKEIANVINRYQQNADKIFRLNDMDVEDVIRISYLFGYNILDHISKKYLPHLPCSNWSLNTDFYLLKIDMRTRRIVSYDTYDTCDFLKNVYIGQHIKKVANKNNCSGRNMAKQLCCTPSIISDLYKCKSLKIKTLILISDILQYHFISEVYLSQMIFISSLQRFDNYIVTVNQQQIRILSPDTKTVLMVFQRIDDKNTESVL